MCEWNLNIILPFLFGFTHKDNGFTSVDPLVDSNVGLIRGLRAIDGDYSMFMGIPYATVNKSNPFGPSIPHPGFHEVFEAYDDSAICPQVEEFNHTIVGTLDCLHLNIYVPNSANSINRLPVLVYIYGGGFMIGFSGRFLYGPRYLVQHDIILVTFNYRVGPYGFMCLNTPEVPGNQGLKDQQLALKWIKDNIEAFGGDSSNIAISGSSSGASSVDFHLIYNKIKTFDKVIMQSGTALYPWSMSKADILAPLKLSKQLGFIATNTEEALTFLSAVDSNLLIAATSDLGLVFRPCVEQHFDNVENFIYDYPININNFSLVNNISILLGYNSDEAFAMYEVIPTKEYATLKLFYDNLEQYFNLDAEDLTKMEQSVKHFYIGDEKISERVKKGLIRLNSDFYFNYPVVRTMQKYLDSEAKHIYYYFFSYSGKRNFLSDRFNVTTRGASHADEIGYLYDLSYMNENPTPEDQLIIDRITTLWTNFVKFGNPIPKANKLLPVRWPIATKDLLYYLHIDLELKVKTRKFKSRMAFWDLIYRLYEKAEVGYQERNKIFHSKESTCDVFTKVHVNRNCELCKQCQYGKLSKFDEFV